MSNFKNIYLLRHGQSEGNANKDVYLQKPDYKVELTGKGREQAKCAAGKLKEIFGEKPLIARCSPFVRAVQTYDIVKGGLNIQDFCEDSRLREREWSARMGGFDYNSELERKQYGGGGFFYRYHSGESGADAADRLYSFTIDIKRSLSLNKKVNDVLVVAHGDVMRILHQIWMRKSYRDMETSKTPWNCSAFLYILDVKTEQFECVNGVENELVLGK